MIWVYHDWSRHCSVHSGRLRSCFRANERRICKASADINRSLESIEKTMKNTAHKGRFFHGFYTGSRKSSRKRVDLFSCSKLFLCDYAVIKRKSPEPITIQGFSFGGEKGIRTLARVLPGYRISSADPSTTWVSLRMRCYYSGPVRKNQGRPRSNFVLAEASLRRFPGAISLLLPDAPRFCRHHRRRRSG